MLPHGIKTRVSDGETAWNRLCHERTTPGAEENVMNGDDNQRRQPPIPSKLISNEFRAGQTRQEKPPKAPFRAITIKAEPLRAAVRNGNQLDYPDMH
jgi:hypothetical protein